MYFISYLGVPAPGGVVRLDHLGARPHGLDAVGLELHAYQAREAPLLFSMSRAKMPRLEARDLDMGLM